MNNRIIRPCGLVIREQRLLLLRYQYGGHDRYNLPGGNLEADEEIPTCLIREFAEELHLTIIPQELILVAETTNNHKTTLHLVFQVTAQGEPQINSTCVKATELLWLEPNAIDTAPLYPAIGHILGPKLRGQTHSPLFLGRIDQPWFE